MNPFKQAKERENEERDMGPVGVAYVNEVFDTHAARIEPLSGGERSYDAIVASGSHEDVSMPSVDSLVMYTWTRKGIPVVIDCLYDPEKPRPEFGVTDGTPDRKIGAHSNFVHIAPQSITLYYLKDDGTTLYEVSVSESGLTVDVANGDVTINADTVTVESGNIELGGSGGDAVARVGDSVSLPDGTGTISSGSSDVSAT